MAAEIAEAVAAVMRREAQTEYKFSLQDSWNVQLFVAVAAKHGLKPYRAPGQKSQTVMVRASKSEIEDKVWPEFSRLAGRLHAALHAATDALIREAVGERCATGMESCAGNRGEASSGS